MQLNDQIILFDALIEPYKVQPLQVRVHPEAMAMKGYSTFPKVPGPKCHYQIV